MIKTRFERDRIARLRRRLVVSGSRMWIQAARPTGACGHAILKIHKHECLLSMPLENQ